MQTNSIAPSLWLTVCMASRWWAAVHSWAPADGSGRHYCLHDQGHLRRQHGWEQVQWELPVATQLIHMYYVGCMLSVLLIVHFLCWIVSQTSRWTLLFLNPLVMIVLWRWKSAPALKDTGDRLAKYIFRLQRILNLRPRWDDNIPTTNGKVLPLHLKKNLYSYDKVVKTILMLMDLQNWLKTQ